jgi:hypothetical protein
VIPAAEADNWFFWLAIIGRLAGIYILPTVIAIARQVEGVELVICPNVFPVGWLAALILASMMPRKQIRVAPYACARTQAPPPVAGRAGRQRVRGWVRCLVPGNQRELSR